MKKISVKTLSRCAMIAAVYFVISAAFLPLAFGPLQIRFAEALTLLPVATPLGVWGVTLGCAVTNAYGVAAGANILGPLDIPLGTAATLAAALMSRGLRGVRFWGLPLLAVLPPVLVNALVIGGELTFAETGRVLVPLLWVNAAYVGLGQLISCAVIGLPLLCALERTGLRQRLFGE